MQEVDREDDDAEEAVSDGNLSEASTVILQISEKESCNPVSTKKRSVTA